MSFSTLGLSVTTAGMATLAFAIALNSYFFNPDNTFSLGPIHAKFSSLLPSDVHRPLLWHRFDMESNYVAYVVCLAFLALSILAIAGKGYETKDECRKVVESIQKEAAKAKIVEAPRAAESKPK